MSYIKQTPGSALACPFATDSAELPLQGASEWWGGEGREGGAVVGLATRLQIPDCQAPRSR